MRPEIPHLFKQRGKQQWWCIDRVNHIRYGGSTAEEAYGYWKSQHCKQCGHLTVFPVLLIGIGKFCSKTCVQRFKDGNSNQNS